VSTIMNDYIVSDSVETLPEPPAYHQRKQVWDRLLAAILLTVLAPLVLILLVLVRATSEGDAIYRQSRVGRRGRRFNVYKIRTMYKNAEAVGGPQWAVRRDARITPVGRALRFLHLDELPQLVNVVKGEMSLIGPRPERPEFVEKLCELVPGYADRLQVLPGITGLAQINLPADESIECVHKKTAIDRIYIENASALYDLRILICTAMRMVGIRHGLAPRLLRVEYVFPEPTPSADEEVTHLGAVDVKPPVKLTPVKSPPRNRRSKAESTATVCVTAKVASGRRSNDGDAHVVAPNRPR